MMDHYSVKSGRFLASSSLVEWRSRVFTHRRRAELLADGTSEFDERRPVAIHARLGEPRHAHAPDFRGFFRSEIPNPRRRCAFLRRADVPAGQCSHFCYSPFWLWPETSSRHPPRWGNLRNPSQRQKCQPCGDFCRFKSRSRLVLRSRRFPQASGLCERIQGSRNGSRTCAAWKSQPVRSLVARSLPIDALIPDFLAMSSSKLVK